MSNPGLIKAFTAGGAIEARRIVIYGATNDTVVAASDGTAHLVGVTSSFSVEQGGVVDVVMSDMPDVTYGGTITAGDPLTATTGGKVVVATTEGTHVIGYARYDGVDGDIHPILIDRCVLAVAGSA